VICSVRVVQPDVAPDVSRVLKRAETGGETKSSIPGKHAFKQNGPANWPFGFHFLMSDLRAKFLAGLAGQYKVEPRFLITSSQNDGIIFKA
jgi:hypothetical protein